MKILLPLALAALLSLASAAEAQYAPGQQAVTSLVGPLQVPVINSGPQNTYVRLNGGTFVCSGGTATVADTNVDAGSVVFITLKTVGGTVAAPFIATITPATGFTVTCGGSDTSTYNYAILG